MVDFVAYNPIEHRGYMPIEARPRVCEDTRGIVAIKDGVPVAICVLDSWTTTLCEIHIWIANPMVLRRGFQQEVFGYVFGEADRLKIIGKTPSNNEKALKFIKHMGFQEIFRVKDGYDVGVDIVVSEINRDDCEYYGKQERHTATS